MTVFSLIMWYDMNAEKVKECWKALGIDYNKFINISDDKKEYYNLVIL